MLTPADDLPLHQTPEPIAFAGTDRNFYDRFFFNGYHEDVFFALALGVYPQLNIMDASFCLQLDGWQHNLRSSKEMDMDRLNLNVGPIAIDLVEPLLRTKVTIAKNKYGISGTLEAQARHAAVAEPRFTRRFGPRAFMDYTRLTQNINWQGEISFAGKTIQISPERFQGTRDRSWGIRPVGLADLQPPVPKTERQFYWIWVPCNFAGHGLFMHSNDDAEGQPWNRRAVLLDIDSGTNMVMDNISFAPEYKQGSRRVQTLKASLKVGDEQQWTAELKVNGPCFYMQGLGYVHRDWGHGMHHGRLCTAFDSIELKTAEDELDAGAIHNLHIQAVSDIHLTREDAQQVLQGKGVIEQLFVGEHQPSGFV